MYTCTSTAVDVGGKIDDDVNRTHADGYNQ